MLLEAIPKVPSEKDEVAPKVGEEILQVVYIVDNQAPKDK